MFSSGSCGSSVSFPPTVPRCGKLLDGPSAFLPDREWMYGSGRRPSQPGLGVFSDTDASSAPTAEEAS